MTRLKALAVCGSLREGSYNRMLLNLAVRQAREAGVEVAECDLRGLALPLYDYDIEKRNLPEAVQRLKAMIEASDLLLLACPEYNASMTPALKNAIDWASRGNNSLAGRIAVIMGATTGKWGTVRSQAHLRQALANLDVLALPQPQVMVREAEKAFSPAGDLLDPKTAEALAKLIRRSVETIRKLKAA